jgi:hypothetical protein
MILKLLSFENIKLYLIIALSIAAVLFWKDYKHQIAENKRQTENLIMLRKQDSLRFVKQVMTQKELKEYLEYNRRDLKEFIKANNIKERRIRQIISQELKYIDTTSKETDLTPILSAIQSNSVKPIKVPVKDVSDCLIIEGYVIFENQTLKLNITERKFTNKSDVIPYVERNQWKFLGIKTRFLGKRQLTVIIKDSCGNTETLVIDVNKKAP